VGINNVACEINWLQSYP